MNNDPANTLIFGAAIFLIIGLAGLLCAAVQMLKDWYESYKDKR